ncbi:MAG: Gfo/Idh/MocA family oxidoreductase [Planctomycetes bacterium]|nr:Gfo/Idh/MocA family oxidoreductase [Planctomycetota bacterium]
MKNKIDRRQFVQSTAAIGAGLFVAPEVLSATASTAKKADINVALIGAGIEGQVLFDAASTIGRKSGIKFKAVCDIWDFKRKKFAKTLKKYKRAGYNNAAYVDYREMLDKEKDNLDAVIIATPDCFHAEHTNACLEAGLHVYCEKEMSNTIEGAKSMVLTARKTGKLLQIGHQRRSNPKYIFAKENIIDKSYTTKKVIDPKTRKPKKDPKTGKDLLIDSTLLGRITTINGQWNRSVSACKDLVAPAGTAIPQATLTKYGFKSMKHFMNWRWYKGLGGGPIVDLGSHQIDIYSWFLGEAKPKSVMASGGVDYWKGHEWYDNVMAVFEFDTEAGPVRAFYQTLTTSSSGGYYEKFMAEHGALEISEDPRFFNVGRDMKVVHGKENPITKIMNVPQWNPWIDGGIITPVPQPKKSKKKGVMDVRSSPLLLPNTIHATMDVPYHQPHLINFFDAIRDSKVKLNCPAEVGYHTAVMVLKVNEAVEARKTLEFKPEDFHV